MIYELVSSYYQQEGKLDGYPVTQALVTGESTREAIVKAEAYLKQFYGDVKRIDTSVGIAAWSGVVVEVNETVYFDLVEPHIIL